METSDAIAVAGLSIVRNIQAEAGSALSTDLPFNPLKLILLITWVYLCMYFIQRANFSPLVPVSYRTVVNVVTLFTGPFLLLTLFLIDTARKTRRTQENFFDILKRQIHQAAATFRSIRFRSDEQDDDAIHLLDTSGRSLDEICGHSDVKRVDAQILGLTEATIRDALDRGASDILIDPRDESTYSIRLRIDGTLRAVKELDADKCRALINSVKAVSGMDISERRRAQDGSFTARRGTLTASFRVASAGALQGEKLSVRVLNQNAGAFTLADMGLPEKQLTVLQAQIQKPSGMILVCGPTGSGKTTTLYAMLNQIEAMLPEASQIEVNPKADITFASTLRSVLRQDPDVICVGEIRDEETAEIALRAAQTGHLVMATIHCESNATAIIRLLDLGISPLLLSAGINLLVSQRLVRCLCEECKAPAKLSDSQILNFRKKGIEPQTIFEAVGCKHCDGTGYSGRTAILDLLAMDDAMRNEIAKTKDGSLIGRLRAQDTQKGVADLRKAGLRKVVAGVTSLDEIKRVVG